MFTEFHEPHLGSYLAVVRFLDEDEHLLHVLFGYDPERFRWVRLSERVDLGPAKSRVGWAVALSPLTVSVDAAALGTDVVLTALLAYGAGSGGGSGSGVVGLFTTLNYKAGNAICGVDPSDELAPIHAPELLPR